MSPQKIGSELGSLVFIIPKTDQTIQFLTGFRKMNKRIVRTLFLISKLSSTRNKLEGFTSPDAVNLNVENYTIRLDQDILKVCTITLPWGKHSHLCLPMDISGALCTPRSTYVLILISQYVSSI